MLLNRGVQRHNGMPSAVFTTRQANIADNDNQAPTRHKDTMTMRPHLIELAEKLVIILNMSQLPVRIPVLLQSPIRRRRKHQVNALGRDCAQVSAIPVIKPV